MQFERFCVRIPNLFLFIELILRFEVEIYEYLLFSGALECLGDLLRIWFNIACNGPLGK